MFLDGERFASLWSGPARAYLFTRRPERFTQLRALAPAPATRVLGRTAWNWLFVNRGPTEAATPGAPVTAAPAGRSR